MKAVLWLCCLWLLGCAHTPPITKQSEIFRLAQDGGPVQVQWRDPAAFTENRHASPGMRERSHWVEELARHVRDLTQPRLAPGEHLDIEFIDIDRAGDYEPWRDFSYRDTRIVREIYPPRIHLRFTRYAADGAIKAQGERALSDVSFMQRSSLIDSDPLRYEKNLLRDWVRREFPGAQH